MCRQGPFLGLFNVALHLLISPEFSFIFPMIISDSLLHTHSAGANSSRNANLSQNAFSVSCRSAKSVFFIVSPPLYPCHFTQTIALCVLALTCQHQQAASVTTLEKTVAERDAAMQQHYNDYISKLQAHHAYELDQARQAGEKALVDLVSVCYYYYYYSIIIITIVIVIIIIIIIIIIIEN
jgi:hypothetical protein